MRKTSDINKVTSGAHVVITVNNEPQVALYAHSRYPLSLTTVVQYSRSEKYSTAIISIALQLH